MNHGEVAFREEIVETVWKQVKPELVWDDTHVQGKGRMQEVIKEKIQISSNPLKVGPLRLGLYGMGGSRKTIMCKVIGNQMMQQYMGKVCHIEFGSLEVLQIRIKMLQNICLLDWSFLLIIDEGQT
ncbi:hypothetical protein M758_UG189500 [Ceratodon purpureus]|nr:hypothetical protein M758_UG189500 [Ceratodon purpureus]